MFPTSSRNPHSSRLIWRLTLEDRLLRISEPPFFSLCNPPESFSGSKLPVPAVDVDLQVLHWVSSSPPLSHGALFLLHSRRWRMEVVSSIQATPKAAKFGSTCGTFSPS